MPGPGVYSFDTNTLSTTGSGTEDTIGSVNVAGVFTLFVDLNDMAAGDVIEFRAYKMVRTGGTSRVMQSYPITLAGAQPTDGLILEIGPIPNDLTDTAAVKFTAKQTFGTAGVSLPWKVVNAFDGTANTTQFNGTAATASGGRPEVNTTHAAGTAWGSGAITAASIAADAITAAKIADGAIDAATFAAGAITATVIADGAIADAVWDEAKSGHTTAGTYGQHFGAATESATVNDAGATTTAFITTLASAVDDHYIGRVIIFTSGTLLNQATDITDYVGATKTVTVTALTSAPANGVSFLVV